MRQAKAMVRQVSLGMHFIIEPYLCDGYLIVTPALYAEQSVLATAIKVLSLRQSSAVKIVIETMEVRPQNRTLISYLPSAPKPSYR
jgi:hypothetical protein